MVTAILVDGNSVGGVVRLESFVFDMRAHVGEVGSGSIIFDDTTGTANPASPMKEWVALEALTTVPTIAGGYIAERSPARGPLIVDTQRQWHPVLEDRNAMLSDRVLKGQSARRPEETDVERIQWLVGTNALGMLEGSDIKATSPETLERTSFRGKTPFDVLNDAAENTNKNFYVRYEAGTGWILFYGPWNQTGSEYTSNLQVSSVLADIDSSTVFGPTEIDVEYDPGRIYSHLVIKWKKGWVTVRNDDTVDDFRARHKMVVRENFKTAARARRWGERQLEKLNEEVTRVSLALTVPPSALTDLAAGKRIQIKLPAHDIPAFEYFRIVGTTIMPAPGPGGASDVLYRVRLTMRDKIRPVMLGDIYADPETTIASGGSGSGEPGNGEGDPRDTPDGEGVDTIQRILDGFDRSGYPTEGDAFLSESVGTSHDITLPDGADQVGKVVLMFLTWTDETELLGAQLEGQGIFTEEQGDSFSGQGGSILFRVIDGSEGWASTGSTVTVTTADSENVMAMTVLVTGFDDIEVASTASANPSSLNPTWATTELARWYTFISASAAVTGDPTGYTNLSSDDDGVIFWRASAKDDDSNTEDPDTYTTAGSAVTFTVAVKGTGEGLGALPGQDVTMGWWEGGNEWLVNPSSATIGIDSNVLYVEATTNTPSVWIVEVLGSDHPDGPFPTLPMEMGDFIIEGRWRLRGAEGNVGHAGLRYWHLGWLFGGYVQINLGDGTNAEGIQAIGSSTDTLTQALPALDAWARMKMRWEDGRVYGKFWDESDDEPDWMVDAPFAPNVDDEDPADLEFIIQGDLGNASGPAQRLEFDWFKIEAVAGSGESVSERVVDHGTAGLIELGHAFVAGTLVVTVDDEPVLPTSIDPDAGTIQLGFTPYHDPTNHPAGCAVVRVTYIRA